MPKNGAIYARLHFLAIFFVFLMILHTDACKHVCYLYVLYPHLIPPLGLQILTYLQYSGSERVNLQVPSLKPPLKSRILHTTMQSQITNSQGNGTVETAFKIRIPQLHQSTLTHKKGRKIPHVEPEVRNKAKVIYQIQG